MAERWFPYSFWNIKEVFFASSLGHLFLQMWRGSCPLLTSCLPPGLYLVSLFGSLWFLAALDALPLLRNIKCIAMAQRETGEPAASSSLIPTGKLRPWRNSRWASVRAHPERQYWLHNKSPKPPDQGRQQKKKKVLCHQNMCKWRNCVSWGVPEVGAALGVYLVSLMPFKDYLKAEDRQN